jgi:hypothetical protein
MKIGDNTRRILLYTQPEHYHKTFFAIARSVYPIRELCGCLSALRWAAKDILGHNTTFLQRIWPAILLNAMASLRGMKPYYVWQSSRPWNDIQLHIIDAIENNASQIEIIYKGIMNATWIIYLIKIIIGNYDKWCTMM